jgi:hypothetical protein
MISRNAKREDGIIIFCAPHKDVTIKVDLYFEKPVGNAYF